MRNSVDFPLPEGPSSATTSPGLICTLTFSRTRSVEPFGIRKSCETFRASHSAAVALAASATSTVTVISTHLLTC